ncbi:aldo/keto reductase [Proteinivorax hydrogeniformans]|uniref:Aldo/keto reductase n=1 Tax=Proteinivorax hydrogeniformans TaxID=1826727 RepID=A0AAU8HUK0_9FIRM
MLRKELAKLPFSSIGFGCYGLGGAYGSKINEKQGIDLIQTAFTQGIKVFDTASSYEGTEEILGKAIAPFRHEVVVASKVGLVAGNIPDLSKRNVIASCKESLKKLGTDYLDIYQIHYDDPKTTVEETVEGLESLKEAGLIRSYGIGHLPMGRMLEYLKVGDVSTVLSEISVINNSSYTQLYPLHKKYGFDIMGFSVTGRGILSGEINHATKFLPGDIRAIDPQFKRSKLKSALRKYKKLKEISENCGVTPVQLAICWVIHKEGIEVALIGPTKKEHLLENSRAAKCSIKKDIIDEIDRFIRKEDEWLKVAVSEDVSNILDNQLNKDIVTVTQDLIYVLEHCLENNLMEHKKGAALYKQVIAVQKSDKSLNQIQEIKEEIKSSI